MVERNPGPQDNSAATSVKASSEDKRPPSGLLLGFLRTPHVPLTLRKKIGKMLKFEAGDPFEINVFGKRYQGIHGIHMDDKIYRYGMHEPATVRLIRHILQKQKQKGRRPVYMDVGTNTGFHLLAASGVAEEAYGFEPWDKVRERAFVNLAANDMDHVKIFDFGLSNSDGQAAFIPPKFNNLGVGAIAETAETKPESNDEKHMVEVPVKTGDRIVSTYNIEPSLIKIDVEGHERSVLEGLHETINTYHPDVIFEYNGRSRADFEKDSVRLMLFGADYRYFGILRSREYPKLEPFDPSKKYENILAVSVNRPQ